MVDTIIDVVDVAKTFKDTISRTTVAFKDPSFRSKINDTDDNAFLRVKKKIGSATTIISVDDINDDYVNKIVLGG